MKLLKITTAYPAYLKQYYANRPELKNYSYATQKASLDYDSFFSEGYWSKEFSKLGYSVDEVIWNCEDLQRAWQRENISNKYDDLTLEDITLEQSRRFKPDVIWLHHWNVNFIKRLRAEVDSLKIVIGWVGSASTDHPFFKEVDIMFSCAPESVVKLLSKGVNIYHVNHWFVPETNLKLTFNRDKEFELTFIGSIVRGDEMHLYREKILEQLMNFVHVDIFAPDVDKSDIRVYLEFIAKASLFNIIYRVKKLPHSDKFLNKFSIFERVLSWKKPFFPINFKLRKHTRAAIFGVNMFEVLRDSKITLNIHADSSPEYASNLRLFEATGVGTCLLTDWKHNMAKLFEPEKEIVTFKSVEECVDKAIWLLENDKERETIAKAGQKRCLRDHTFDQRVAQMDEIIRKHLK